MTEKWILKIVFILLMQTRLFQEHMDELESNEELLIMCLDTVCPLISREQHDNMSPHAAAVVRNLVILISLKLLRLSLRPKVSFFFVLKVNIDD